jgi:hypothetical protein
MTPKSVTRFSYDAFLEAITFQEFGPSEVKPHSGVDLIGRRK